MAEVVFECSLDEATLISLNELRNLRLDVIKRQIHEIDRVVATLINKGVFLWEEREAYRQAILSELQEKFQKIQHRLREPRIIYSDEIELYLSVLDSAHESSSS